MSRIIKAAKLDFMLVKYQMKSICFTIFIPLIFLLVYRSLITGISFAMFMMAMSSIYTFSVADKNDMHRLYGILPISNGNLVFGKYLHLLMLGALSLLISGVLQPILLHYLGETVSYAEMLAGIGIGIVLFVTYIAFQIPGYYKYGPIKGRIFMYLPVAGIILTMFVLEKLNFSNLPIQMLSRNQYILPVIAVIYIILALLISIKISVNIVNKKEW